MNRSAVLVIDDNECWRHLLTKLLDVTKYNVYSAATCAAGISMAEVHRPDCIVVDFHLTDGNSVDVCMRVRSHSDIKNTPIVILSSDPDAEVRADSECRADKFILKGEPLAKIRSGIEGIVAVNALRTRRV
ncbi:MAG: hypothetical protein A2270_08480 [Elusimicrobia bacterium RIFOXYA12_FULL_51_18]|nr:MAG: hypothetical protein A2270_08480 [Elusimicrobia bacterium RIFOXYA12_FULL_51_18]OGS28660.1 MAG: hypothetical protein A2218_09795 [Elusimicrobia bacterium RIFOXYA2_FULL_53_38]